VRKVRTQIQLDSRDHARLKAFAERHRLSMAAAVRMLVQQGLGDEPRLADERWEAFLRAGGTGRERDGARDVARNHDRYLYGGA
jgi:hypothetical protein